jgi:N-acetyl-anhydromuramyl-L-alanine amidase AmpD
VEHLEIPFIKEITSELLLSIELPPGLLTDELAARGDDEPADYPDAQSFTPAPYFCKWSHDEARSVDRIVIHITAGQADYRRTVRFFQAPTRHGEPVKVSAHYVVGREGEVVQMVRNDDIAYHACSANKRSIGIEHCARPPRTFGHDDAGLMPTRVQYESSARLVRYLCALYGLPLDRRHVIGHVEADPKTSHTSCPGGAWDWDEYMSILLSLG